MNLTELRAAIAAGQDINKAIELLKGKRTLPKVDDFKKQYDVKQHEVFDTAKRKDKTLADGTLEMVNRLGFSFQELITERAVSFLFGLPPKLVCDPQGEGQKKVLAAINRIFKDNKIPSFNAEIALEMFKSTEVAECWFPVKKDVEHEDYGFKTPFKLRVMAFNPWDGNELYPLFDETGDMIAFSRAYVLVDEAGKNINYFETYTDAEKIVWKEGDAVAGAGGWVQVSRETNVIGKIPIVYGRQKEVEWANVESIIKRLEYLLSNFADTDDYHGSPTIFVQGELKNMAKKGESGKLIEGKNGATAEYLSWSHAPEAIKLEIETLLRFMFSLTQTPDISFEAVKGLGEISGVALKMLFLDAHLKVKKKQRVFDAYLERRVNIVKAFVGMMATSLKADVSAIDIETEIQPFIIDDEAGLVSRLVTANGGKPLISKKTATALSGLVDNVEEEMKQMQAESQQERSFDVTETAF
ncbi:phage portal protein [Siphonobacter sp. SORGH_AS_1065]|uniref:phage portal protein n=1 Tax=Siphonobacter sp. SORGH_AS_1065 TaxID=3041795 RepID=UPI00277E825B|nr:phage portal protein [Siphonobacter sp. SORGH_AS_1065]MDQ1088580.1 SPP1 family phage portal protein [Siphonobacter sp. SORGH_AS_1065]